MILKKLPLGVLIISDYLLIIQYLKMTAILFLNKEEGFEIIDKVLDWCKACSLNLVLDMHKAPGYAFYNNPNDNTLFTDENVQNRFVSLWREIAKRYKTERDNIVFELLNEIVDAHDDSWNKISRKE